MAVPDQLEIVGAIRDALSDPDLAGVIRDDARAGAVVKTLRSSCHPDLVVEMTSGGPGLRQEFRGLDGLVEAWRDWLAPYESFRVTIEDEIHGGGDTFVGFARQTGVLAGGGEITADAAGVFHFRDGLLARLEFHLDRGEALRSAGLDPA